MITAQWNKVLLKKLPGEDEEKVSPGGIILPGGDRPAKSNMMKAIVLDVGPAGDGKPAATVKRGDVVVFNKYAADFFAIKGFDVIVASSLDVWVNISASAEDVTERDVQFVLAAFDALSEPPVDGSAQSAA